VDQQAAGDIDASTADPSLIKVSRDLPINRFDMWFSRDGSPSFMDQVGERKERENMGIGREKGCD
jgi:hypothetical protein